MYPDFAVKLKLGPVTPVTAACALIASSPAITVPATRVIPLKFTAWLLSLIE
jgi:hypothetical protein